MKGKEKTVRKDRRERGKGTKGNDEVKEREKVKRSCYFFP